MEYKITILVKFLCLIWYRLPKEECVEMQRGVFKFLVVKVSLTFILDCRFTEEQIILSFNSLLEWRRKQRVCS